LKDGAALIRIRARVLYIVLLLLSFSGGCAQRPPFDLGLGPIRGPDDIVRRVNENAHRLHSLRAEAQLHSAQVPRSHLAKVSVLFAEPDHYRVKFSALFGRTMALMLVQGGEVSIYIPSANRLYEGQATPEILSHVVGIDMGLSDLMEALMGHIRLPPISDLLDYRIMEDGYQLIFKRPEGRQEVQVGPDGLRVFRAEFFDIHGQSFLVKTFRDHQVVDGVVRPGEVHLTLPGREEEIRLTFSAQRVNPQIREEEFQQQFPDSVERIHLQFE
jgi:outer membrane lipoprotein-sorting protein